MRQINVEVHQMYIFNTDFWGEREKTGTKSKSISICMSMIVIKNAGTLNKLN